MLTSYFDEDSCIRKHASRSGDDRESVVLVVYLKLLRGGGQDWQQQEIAAGEGSDRRSTLRKPEYGSRRSWPGMFRRVPTPFSQQFALGLDSTLRNQDIVRNFIEKEYVLEQDRRTAAWKGRTEGKAKNWFVF